MTHSRSFRAPLGFSVAACLLLLAAAPREAQAAPALRWAAIGDAVSTAGWPARAGVRLPADSIINFGHSGGTALRSGDSSYWNSERLAEVFAYQPEIISIHLGSSDSKPVNWADSANFASDYKALIDTLASMPSQPRILVVFPTPVWTDEAEPQSPDLRRGSVIAGSIIPTLRAIALETGSDTVNLHDPLLTRQNLFPNGHVPSAAGNDTLGRLVFRAFVDQSIRIMCVGNSITFGHGLNSRDAYPVTLNRLLGPRYWVWNGGKSGWWMQRAQLPGASSNFRSYVTDATQMDSLFLLNPHVIAIKLGTNDARENFWNTARYVDDYLHFIDTLYDNMTPKPKLVLMKAFPAWRINGNWQFSNGGANTPALNGINGDIIRDSLGPAIDVIAAARTTQVTKVIDLHAPFVSETPTLAPDGVHPNKTGMDSLARVVYNKLLPLFTTSITPAVPRAAPRAPSAPALRVQLTDGRVPEWMRGTRIMTADGKVVTPDASGMLPAGIYLARPPENVKLEK